MGCPKVGAPPYGAGVNNNSCRSAQFSAWCGELAIDVDAREGWILTNSPQNTNYAPRGELVRGTNSEGISEK
jgi:hypothetical protein